MRLVPHAVQAVRRVVMCVHGESDVGVSLTVLLWPYFVRVVQPHSGQHRSEPKVRALVGSRFVVVIVSYPCAESIKSCAHRGITSMRRIFHECLSNLC